ncbi:MAG: tRNA adenosine(34) deaminase TadA [Clostridia bacterium]|nr:tRNA adenosine(34) deaminase TadA [Clostridia bacterium]
MEERFMKAALSQAKLAAKKGEVPVGAVIVRDGEIIARAYNTRETDKNALCHAEIKAIRKACKKLGGWRLTRCELYVTLEPCPMCAGAIVNSRIVSVYYGASDKKAGAFGTLFDMNTMGLNHKPEIIGGVMEKECAGLLLDFFSELRKRKKAEKIAQKAES